MKVKIRSKEFYLFGGLVAVTLMGFAAALLYDIILIMVGAINPTRLSLHEQTVIIADSEYAVLLGTASVILWMLMFLHYIIRRDLSKRRRGEQPRKPAKLIDTL